MKTNLFRYVIILITISVCISLFSQQSDELDYSQLPDKTYLHFDRNMYSPGDTMWIKSYVIHRNNNRRSDNSYALHIQLLSENGEQVGTYKMLMVDGMGYGQIPIYETLKPGFYQIVAHTNHMKNFGFSFFYKKEIEIRPKATQVTIKTFFDKKKYSVGDTAHLTFKAYDEFLTPIPKKHFRYRFAHQDKNLKKAGVRCDDNAEASLYLPITCGSKANPPLLELSYYLNIDDDAPITSNVYVPMKEELVNLTFYPESGNIISGLDTKIAFEARDVNGSPIEIEGILYKDGEELLTLHTLHEGMGIFSLKGDDSHYTFKINTPTTIDSIYTLPKALPNGYGFSYLKQDKKNIELLLAHNYKETKKVSLWISKNDQLLDAFDIEVTGSRIFHLSKSMMPEGIVTLTVTDDLNRPCAELLVYNYFDSKEIKVSTRENIYSKRKKVEVSIDVTDPKVTQLSVSVVDSVLALSPNLHRDNMKSFVMLSSELRGNIKNAPLYLSNDNVGNQLRTLLLRTHGWRKYNWLKNKAQLDSMSVLDLDFVDGRVTRFKKEQANAKLTAMVMGDFLNFSKFRADDHGCFRVHPIYNDRSSQKILIQATNAKGKSNVEVRLSNMDTLLFSKVVDHHKDDLKSYLEKNDRFFKEKKEEDELPFMAYESKLLKELVVYGDVDAGDSPPEISEGLTAFAAGFISGSSLYDAFSFADFVEQASHRVTYDISADCIFVRGVGASSISSTSPLEDSEEEDISSYGLGAEIYVNDVSWGKSPSALDFLTKEDIAEIVVLDPNGAYAMYGSEGEYGVILVRTYSTDFQMKDETSKSNLAIFGRFLDSRECYSPIYETKAQDSLVVVDNRITLHWEPFIETDSMGHAEFSFYTDDIDGRKLITIQGLDDEGNFYYSNYGFDVNAPDF